MPESQMTSSDSDHSDALPAFDWLIDSILQALLTVSQTTEKLLIEQNLDQIATLTSQLKETANTKAVFQFILSRRQEKIARFLLTAFRHRSPSLSSKTYSEDVAKTLTECIKNGTETIFRVALRDATFAQILLQEKLHSHENAFSLSVLLCQVISSIIKIGGPDKARWWMTVDKAGELLLVKQILQCLGCLLPEIGLPIFIKLDGQTVDFYTYLLNWICSLIPIMKEDDMTACVVSLVGGLRSNSSALVALFTSDVLKFIVKISSTNFAFSLLMEAVDAFNAWLQTGSGHYEIIRMTCCRILEELASCDKGFLSECLPIRRHFFIWSHFPPKYFLEHPLILEELYSECLLVIREAIRGPPKSSESLACLLCRLQLSLKSLCGLAEMDSKQREAIQELKSFNKDLTKVFIPLWNLLISVPEKNKLPMVQVSVCNLLRLGSLIQGFLNDSARIKVLRDLNSLSLDDKWIVVSAGLFVGSLGKQKKLSGNLPILVQNFFSVWCMNPDKRTRYAAISAFVKFATSVRCEAIISGPMDKWPEKFVMDVVSFSQPNEILDENVIQLLVRFQSEQYPIAALNGDSASPVTRDSPKTNDAPDFDLNF